MKKKPYGNSILHGLPSEQRERIDTWLFEESHRAMDRLDARRQRDGKGVREQRLRLAWSQRMVGGAGCWKQGQRASAIGRLGHAEAVPHAMRDRNFKCVLFFPTGRTGQPSIPAHPAKKGCAQAEESRLAPLYPGKNLVCEKIYFFNPRSCRTAPAAQYQELRGTRGACRRPPQGHGRGEFNHIERKEHIDRKETRMKTVKGNWNFDRIYRINSTRMDRMGVLAHGHYSEGNRGGLTT
ncbi:MAG: hypothetical protein JWR26_995 [Pedosphaera sp.]|nr:hypothetical protein [Pedosphaera sp.]